jgi:hypothetical protein
MRLRCDCDCDCDAIAIAMRLRCDYDCDCDAIAMRCDCDCDAIAIAMRLRCNCDCDCECDCDCDANAIVILRDDYRCTSLSPCRLHEFSVKSSIDERNLLVLLQLRSCFCLHRLYEYCRTEWACEIRRLGAMSSDLLNVERQLPSNSHEGVKACRQYTSSTTASSHVIIATSNTTRPHLYFFSARYEQEGPLLVTHQGLSGPAVLRLSSYGT